MGMNINYIIEDRLAAVYDELLEELEFKLMGKTVMATILDVEDGHKWKVWTLVVESITVNTRHDIRINGLAVDTQFPVTPFIGTDDTIYHQHISRG